MRHQEELLLNDYYTISVTFSATSVDKVYTYKVDKSMKVEAEDLVIVLANGEYKIVKVFEVHEQSNVDFNSNVVYKYIVDVIDFTTYRKLQERSKAIANTLADAARSKLKTEMLESMKGNLGEAEMKVLAASCGNDFLGSK